MPAWQKRKHAKYVVAVFSEANLAVRHERNVHRTAVHTANAYGKHRRVGRRAAVGCQDMTVAVNDGVDVPCVVRTHLVAFRQRLRLRPFRRAAEDVVCFCNAALQLLRAALVVVVVDDSCLGVEDKAWGGYVNVPYICPLAFPHLAVVGGRQLELGISHLRSGDCENTPASKIDGALLRRPVRIGEVTLNGSLRPCAPVVCARQNAPRVTVLFVIVCAGEPQRHQSDAGNMKHVRHLHRHRRELRRSDLLEFLAVCRAVEVVSLRLAPATDPEKHRAVVVQALANRDLADRRIVDDANLFAPCPAAVVGRFRINAATPFSYCMPRPPAVCAYDIAAHDLNHRP